MIHRPRVVLDTNVVLSSLLFAQGRLVALRKGWQTAQFEPLISSATTVELVRALTYPKFGLSKSDQEELLSDYLPFCAAVAIPTKPPRTPICRDLLDVPFLQLAIAGKAEYLITGDKDLLAIESPTSFSITTAARFFNLLSGR